MEVPGLEKNCARVQVIFIRADSEEAKMNGPEGLALVQFL